jgi:hypothetical protein
MKYRIEPSETGWVIVHARDDGLAWSGQCWVDREQAARLIRFTDEAAAHQYEKEVFGGDQ